MFLVKETFNLHITTLKFKLKVRKNFLNTSNWRTCVFTVSVLFDIFRHKQFSDPSSFDFFLCHYTQDTSHYGAFNCSATVCDDSQGFAKATVDSHLFFPFNTLEGIRRFEEWKPNVIYTKRLLRPPTQSFIFPNGCCKFAAFWWSTDYEIVRDGRTDKKHGGGLISLRKQTQIALLLCAATLPNNMQICASLKCLYKVLII